MDGLRRIVYGFKKVGPCAVETEGGKFIRGAPLFPLGDCRGCSLLDITCVGLDYPCEAILEKCRKHAKEADCTDCEKLADCLSDKPCCWDCKHLMECLEIAKKWGADEFVEDRLKCSWEEFVEAVRMLAE